MATEGQQQGLSRRDLIRRGAIAAGAAWTAPLVVQSMTSPAGALSPTGGYPCSYITVVYKVGTTYYAAKFNNGASVCSGNSTSGDETFTQSCGGFWYTNVGSGNKIRQSANGTTYTTLADGTCGTYLTYAGGTTISAKNGATIVFAAAHDGSYAPPSKFKFICPASPSANNSVTAPACGSV